MNKQQPAAAAAAAAATAAAQIRPHSTHGGATCFGKEESYAAKVLAACCVGKVCTHSILPADMLADMRNSASSTRL
jgi:hypothetical protein